jgi:quercetin dioxygenase-like cupin family protein
VERDNPVSETGSGQAADVVTFEMPSGLVFDWHQHEDHQLAWAASGVLTVRTECEAWVLPPTRSLFIPAGVRHETLSAGNATMRAVYLRPHLCAVNWQVCTPVAATPLFTELTGYLGDPSLDPQRRSHGETMLVDLLEPVTMTNIDVRMPSDERAKAVAQVLLDNPADGRTLAGWGRDVGASERTLARAFLTDTGLSFGQWRGLLRIGAAIMALATGEPRRQGGSAGRV